MPDAKSIIANSLGVPEASIPDDASLDDFELWDSLGHLRIITELESYIGRDLETEEILSINSIEDIEIIIKNK